MAFIINCTVLLFTLFLNASILLAKENYLLANKNIDTLLETKISYKSPLGGKLILVVEQNISNNSQNVLIPKGTKIICKHMDTQNSKFNFAVYGSCNRMVFNNGKTIDFQSDIYDAKNNLGLSAKKGSTIPLGTKIILKPKKTVYFN